MWFVIHMPNFNFLSHCSWNLKITNGHFIHAEIYWSSNWPLFTRGQNAILNWVLKLNSLNPINKKSDKNCLECLDGALSVLFFFTFRSHQGRKKSVQKEKLLSRELNACARQTFFSVILLLNKITPLKFINNPHSK